MALQTAEGDRLTLRQFQGQPLLLFLFATFDLGSQYALVPLKDILNRHPSLQVLGIAVQANPATLLPIFAEGLEIGFPLVYDPESTIVDGSSPLGEIPAVPAFLLLDSQGRMRGHFLGVPTVAELEQLLALPGT